MLVSALIPAHAETVLDQSRGELCGVWRLDVAAFGQDRADVWIYFLATLIYFSYIR